MKRREPYDREVTDARNILDGIDNIYLSCETYEQWRSMSVPDAKIDDSSYEYAMYLKCTSRILRVYLNNLLKDPETYEMYRRDDHTLMEKAQNLRTIMMEGYSYPHLRTILHSGECYGTTVAVETTLVWSVLVCIIKLIKIMNPARLAELQDLEMPLAFISNRYKNTGCILEDSYISRTPKENAPSLHTACLLLWPDFPVSWYTQKQLMWQIDKFLSEWNSMIVYKDTDIIEGTDGRPCVVAPEMTNFLNMMMTRFAEIVCHSWYHSPDAGADPGFPLDGNEQHIILQEMEMVPETHAKIKVTIGALNESLMGGPKTERASARQTHRYTVNRRYINCFLSKAASLYRLFSFINCTIHARYVGGARAEGIKNTLTDRALATIIRTDAVNFNTIANKTRQYVLGEAVKVADSRLSEAMQLDARCCYIMDSWKETYAYNNNLILPNEPKWLEHAVGTRLSVECMMQKLLFLKPHQFMEDWWPEGVRSVAVTRFVDNIINSHDRSGDWSVNSLVWGRQLIGKVDDITSIPALFHSRDAPYIIQIFGTVFVAIPKPDMAKLLDLENKSGNTFYYVMVADIEEAFAMWLMLMIWNHNNQFNIGIVPKHMPYLTDVFAGIVATHTQ